MELRELLLGLIIVWLAAKLAGEGLQRLGQTAVLGELLAGVLIGPGVLGLVHESAILHALAEIGVVILLFEIGLESDLDELLRAGLQSTVVAVVGVACPFLPGYTLAASWGEAPLVAVFVGAALSRGSLIVYAVLFCVLLAAVADRVGLATIIGAFAAGLILARTERRAHIEEQIKPVADLFVPIFFVTIGMKVQPATLNPFAAHGGLALAVLLTAVAVLAKLAAGLGVYQRGVRRWLVGVGMIPRGEVGLIFAGVGLANGVIEASLYAALVAMVMVTTFVAPLWLKALYRAS